MVQRHDTWFQITEIEAGIFAIEEPGHVQSYMVNGRTASILVDTGMGFSDILAATESMLRERVIVLNTHWHFDHIGGNGLFHEIGISATEGHLIARDVPNDWLMKVYINPCLVEGIPLPDDFDSTAYEIKGTDSAFTIRAGDRFNLGDRIIEAISTPGHTRGSMSFLDSATGSLFCGDLLYPGTLYAHFEDSDPKAYRDSLRGILMRHDEIRMVCGGHNEYPVSKDLVTSALEGFSEILEGGLTPRVGEDWGVPVHRYEFHNFAVLTRVPGSEGVKLFP